MADNAFFTADKLNMKGFLKERSQARLLSRKPEPKNRGIGMTAIPKSTGCQITYEENIHFKF